MFLRQRILRAALGCATLAMFTAVAAPAAATITWGQGEPELVESDHHLIDNGISRADCLDSTSISYTVTTDVDTNNVEVWATTNANDDCVNDVANSQACVQLVSGLSPTNLEYTVTFTTSELAGAVGDVDVSTCSKSSSTETPLYVDIIEYTGGTPTGSTLPLQFTVDLLGPAMPTLDSVDRAGTGTLTLNASNLTTEVEGLWGYCSEATSGGSGGAGGGSSAACAASDLTPGAVPDDEPDATSDSGSSVSVGELANDVLHACAVAGRDDYNNPGPLSEVLCNTPVEAIGFAPEATCFCAAPGATRQQTRRWGSVTLLLLGGILLLRRRERREGRS